jgi:hypothetical protein
VIVPSDPSEGRVEALAEARVDDEAIADLGLMPGEDSAVGCWRTVTEEWVPGAPAWIRLTEAPAGAGPAGARKIETESGEQPVEPYGASWILLGPDSVMIRLPPVLLRLAVEGNEMRGTALSEQPADPAAKGSQAVTFLRVECPVP